MRHTWKRALLLGFVTLSMLLFASTGYASDPYSDELERLSHVFVCNCNCGTQINPFDETQCPTAKVFRQEVVQMLSEGKSEIEIRDHYVAQFGETILRAPLKTGFSLAAWISPFAVLAVGGAGLWYFLRRRIGRAGLLQATNAGAAQVSSLDDELYQEMIELERKKLI